MSLSSLIWSCCCFAFFFSSRRRHTRSNRDWSSDVCSSDLGATCSRRAASSCPTRARGSSPTLTSRRATWAARAARADPSADAVAPVLFAAEDAGGTHLAPGVQQLAPRHVGVGLDDLGEVSRRCPQLVHDPRGQWTH